VNGAGAYIEAGNIEMNGCTFTNNTVTSNGGAAYVNGNGTSLVNCNFTNNTASSTGGALYLTTNANNTNIESGVFKSNKADNASSLYVGSVRNIVSNCNFTDEVATTNGGAIVIDNGNNQIIGSNFTNCSANNQGGAIYSKISKTDLDIIDCIFIKNRATEGSACYSSQLNIVRISGSTFEDNNASNIATVYFHGIGITISNSTFNNNVAQQHAGLYLQVDGQTGNIIGCNFTNNNATNGDGGAIYDYSSRVVTVSDSRFENNSASGNGGAIFVTSRACTVVADSHFINNTAGVNGGAIYVAGDNVTVTSSEFTQNKAINGSAIYVNNETAQNFTVKDSTFTNNRASGNGTIYIKNVTGLKFGDNTFTGNTPHGTDDNYYILDKENPQYTSKVVYVNATGGGTGLTDKDPTTWEIANKMLENPGVIILLSDIDIENMTFSNKNVTIVGNGHVLNRKSSASDKYMFTLLYL
ncbi:MAG: right-handed parallel beta-helix repeat-containing protein, partial [Methanobrevibacter sp.]|nr:right-handed parallel beta-helix repeat-containing protein [Methanobrevibacter sp.]